MRRIPAINPLRGLAAALVLCSHVAFWSGAASVDGAGRLLARGDAGVAVFFAVSAFLLTRRACSGEPVEADYVCHRVARIVPAYLAALVAVLSFAATRDSGVGGLGKVMSHLLILQGFTQDPYRSFTQTWSLTTEISFYALVPLICIWLSSHARHGASVETALGLTAAGGIAIQAFSASSGRAGLGALSTSVLGHAVWFVVGIAWAWWTRPACAGWADRVDPARALMLAALSYLLVATPLGGPVALSRPDLGAAAAKEALYALIAGCLLAAATRTHATWCDSDVARRAGDISYGVFLWHVLVLDVLFTTLRLHLFHAPFLLVAIVTTVASVGIAALSWRYLERPAIHWSHRRPG